MMNFKLIIIITTVLVALGCSCGDESDRVWRVQCESGFDTGWVGSTNIEGGMIYWREQRSRRFPLHAHAIDLGDTCTDRKRSEFDVD